MIEIHSKLPAQGVTIFSIMTALAQKLNALNLSQGFPDFPAPQALLEALAQATLEGNNQYSPGDGVLALRQELAKVFLQRDGLNIDITNEMTITPGGTIGIFCAITITSEYGSSPVEQAALQTFRFCPNLLIKSGRITSSSVFHSAGFR